MADFEINVPLILDRIDEREKRIAELEAEPHFSEQELDTVANALSSVFSDARRHKNQEAMDRILAAQKKVTAIVTHRDNHDA